MNASFCQSSLNDSIFFDSFQMWDLCNGCSFSYYSTFIVPPHFKGINGEHEEYEAKCRFGMGRDDLCAMYLLQSLLIIIFKSASL